MSLDPKRFSRLLFLVSSGFIGLYLAFSIRRLYRAYQHPESVPPDAISPVVDLAVIATVVLAYVLFLVVRHLRGREERAIKRYYAERKKGEC